MRPVATAVLFLLAAWLGLELWRARLERTTSLADVSAKKRQLAALRTKLDAVTAARAPAAKHESDPAQGGAEAKATINRPAAPKPLDPRIANRAKELSRRNTLNNYADGLDRLRLPPDTLALAKEIILARDQASADASKQRLSIEEVVEEANRLNAARDAQLTALLGVEAVAELKAANREDSIDWTIGTDMWDAGAPLTPDQLRRLARAEVQTGYRSERWPLPQATDQVPHHQTGLSSQDAALLAATSTFLSETQQKILQRSLIEEHQYNAAMRAFGEKQKKLLGAR